MSKATKAFAIYGGIGTGKSMVSRILKTMGFEVIDCDTVARNIMDSSEMIHQRLINDIHPNAVLNGVIDRKLVASIVFNDKSKLHHLNSLVHSEVKNYIARRIFATPSETLFVETAILYQSGIDKMVDGVIEIIADKETCIERVMNRNSLSRAEVISRIKSQEFNQYCPHPNAHTIINDGREPILPQVESLLRVLKVHN